MDIATLLMAHYALSLGSLRGAARALGRPVASVSAALARLQSHIATPLTTTTGNRILPTLEGRRLARDLRHAADLILDLATLSKMPDEAPVEQHAARMSVSLLALSRLLVVARTGSIRSAAMEIGIGQPQLTRQLKSLEQDIGAALLDRTASGAVPTEEGKGFLILAEELETIWLRISDHAGERFRRTSRMINLGSVAPLGRESRIAKILALLAAGWPLHQPHNPLYISSTNAEELLSGLNSRQYDIVFLDTVDVPAGIDHRVVSRSGLSVVGSAKAIEAQRHDLKRLLINTPLALPSLKSGLRQKFVSLSEDILRPEERSRLSFVEIDSIPVIANLVIEHGYIALLPQWAISGVDEKMEAIPLPQTYDMQLSLAWKKNARSENVASLVQRILADGGLMEA
ncbi:LysR family nitrogen assimilation transcriptional regulator [Rhizobium petrolearium]|uniref:LysR family transcriptional regulator n=1 Tax=Neorhizobium phenanthreniclasticum TaxID=3157917 RepID=A0ABV0M079_9HYPH|nr:LysR family transcriptional regulator [Neorhizobium petrolearium]MBP1844808.1 LysR family nitrogen assimilation transcriptional regulator [Neorhizobium petrolearium]